MQMDELEKAINYKFQNKNLLIQAITHTSYSVTSFQTLEFLGDRVLGLIVATLLINNNSDIEIKKLANNFAMLVSTSFLIKIAKDWKIEKFLKHSIQNISQKVLVDCIEAIIGAIYLDCGYEKTQKKLAPLWKEFLEMEFIEPKMLLQEFSQKLGLGVPNYTYIQTIEENKIIYEATVNIETLGNAFASGFSKHEASKKAAKKLLEKLNEKNISSI